MNVTRIDSIFARSQLNLREPFVHMYSPEVFSINKRTSSANLDRLLNMLNSGDLDLIPLSPAKYNIKAILSSARQRWEKVCEDLQLPPKWKTITGKEVNFSHASVPPIFRAMALLKKKNEILWLTLPQSACK